METGLPSQGYATYTRNRQHNPNGHFANRNRTKPALLRTFSINVTRSAYGASEACGVFFNLEDHAAAFKLGAEIFDALDSNSMIK
jgi:hypothetical protein